MYPIREYYQTLRKFQKLEKYFNDLEKDVAELDFNDKVRFFDFEQNARSRSGSRENSFDENSPQAKAAEDAILEDDLTSTPTKELKKQQECFGSILRSIETIVRLDKNQKLKNFPNFSDKNL